MMVTSSRVMLDACVLIPYTLCDTLLSLADRRLFVPQWSAEILGEMERNAILLLQAGAKSADNVVSVMCYRRNQMEVMYPDAAQEMAPEEFVDA